MNYKVYVLESEKNGLRYVGHTQDLVNRLKEHNANRTASTQGKGPWKLIYSEDFSSLKLAKNREKFFKTGRGRIVLKNHIGAVRDFRGSPDL